MNSNAPQNSVYRENTVEQPANGLFTGKNNPQKNAFCVSTKHVIRVHVLCPLPKFIDFCAGRPQHEQTPLLKDAFGS